MIVATGQVLNAPGELAVVDGLYDEEEVFVYYAKAAGGLTVRTAVNAYGSFPESERVRLGWAKYLSITVKETTAT